MKTRHLRLASGLTAVAVSLWLGACSSDDPLPGPSGGPPPPVLPQPATLTAFLNTNQIVVDLVRVDCQAARGGTDPVTLLWLVPVSQAFAGICDPLNIFPVVAPDGHQMTFGEWITAAGGVTLTCLPGGGTQFDVNLTGLIPNGVYTIWHFTSGAGGALASHPNDINNIFVANASGAVNASVVSSEGAMTFFGRSASCQLPVPLRGEVDDGVTMVLLYHTDNKSWGPVPGPESTTVAHMLVMGL